MSLDLKTIHELSLVINDYTKRYLDHNSSRKKINGLLHNQSTENILKIFNVLIKDISDNRRNRATLIVVMALLLRNSDDYTRIQTNIQENKLGNCLFGGLSSLLSGKSDTFNIRCKLAHESFNNKYEYLLRFQDFCYWDYYLFFKSAELLYSIDKEKFEKLVLKDNTQLLLLNMISLNLVAEPSDKLIKQLLSSKDELQRNIGLCFISRKLTFVVNEFGYYYRCQKNGLPITKDKKVLQKELNFHCGKFLSYINGCEKTVKAELLFNYFMTNLIVYPNIVLEELMNSELQIEFANQIRGSGKVKTLGEVCYITQAIKNNLACNENNKQISKMNLFMAITELLISFFENRKIYAWGEKEANFMEIICKCLPVRCLNKLRKYLTQKKPTLFCEEIDRLVRYKLYLQDKKQYDIIKTTLNFL